MAPDSNEMTVTISATASKGGATSFQIPNWAPGSYRLVDNYKKVTGGWAKNEKGETLSVTHPDNNTWTVASKGSKMVNFSYKLPSGLRDNRAHITGPDAYMYVVGRKWEDCTLHYVIPTDWRTACGLDGVNNTYKAPDYDTMADAPVTVGKFVMDSYTVAGKPHYIVYFGGDPAWIDRKQAVKECKHVTLSHLDFWGSLPYNKYVWHFTLNQAPDGGWGLEHLSSTTMGVASGLGPGVVSVMQHENFHAWNVKRIRSKVLGPFDYLVLPKTGALWWLEGVTDYYASFLLFRYGRFDEKSYWQDIVQNVSRTRADQDRFEVSPYQASYRVGDAANGRGNSGGFGVNYYNTGWLLGMLLDIEILYQSKGKHCLDDVIHQLYKETSNGQPGFEEGRLRQLIVKFGGPSLNQSYTDWVKRPGELPVEAQLAKVGLVLEEKVIEFADLGAMVFVNREGKPQVFRTSWNEGLKGQDQVLSINGTKMDGTDRESGNKLWSEAMGKIEPGDSVTIKVLRDGTETDVTFEARTASRTERKVIAAANPTPAQLALRKAWYKLQPIPMPD